jgi:C1A family cysteine protease
VQRVTPGDESALRGAVATRGPVSAVVRAGNWLAAYKSGIANPACDDTEPADYHAVLIVGFDSTAPTPYWWVKNSWGTSWGEQGYFRIVMNQNKCGIADYAIFPQS